MLEDDTLALSGDSGVCANDTAAEDDPLTAFLANNVSHGSLTFSMDGGFTYAPKANWAGSESFTYWSIDADSAASDTATVAIEVRPVNDTPVLTDIPNQSILENAAFDSIALAALVSDVDDPDSALTWTCDGDTADLSISIAEGIARVAVRDSEWNDTAVITFTATDTAGLSASDQATFVVSPVNDTPEITGQDPLSTAEETPLVLELADLRVYDPDNAFPADFALRIGAGDNYSLAGDTVTPDSEYNGHLTVPVRVFDGADSSNIYELSISVTPVSDIPRITGQSLLEVDEDTPLKLSLADFSVADADNIYPDDFTLMVHDGANYAVSGDSVIPKADFSGELTVPLRVFDGGDSSGVFDAVVTVIEVNDPPTITAQNSLETQEDTPFPVQISQLTVVDPDDATISIRAHGGTNYTVTGVSEITPAANFTGDITVPLMPFDGTDSGAIFDISITVTPVNDPPMITAQSALETPEETPLSITTSSITISDPDNTTWDLTVHDGSNYTVSGSDVVPGVDFNGELTVPVRAWDGEDSSAVYDLTMVVSGVNDAPVIAAQTRALTIDQGNSLTIELAHLSVTDPDNSYPADFALQIQDGTDYTVSENTVTPSADFAGNLAVGVAVHDGTVASAEFSLTVLIRGWSKIGSDRSGTGISICQKTTGTPFISYLANQATAYDRGNPAVDSFDINSKLWGSFAPIASDVEIVSMAVASDNTLFLAYSQYDGDGADTIVVHRHSGTAWGRLPGKFTTENDMGSYDITHTLHITAPSSNSPYVVYAASGPTGWPAPAVWAKVYDGISWMYAGHGHDSIIQNEVTPSDLPAVVSPKSGRLYVGYNDCQGSAAETGYCEYLEGGVFYWAGEISEGSVSPSDWDGRRMSMAATANGNLYCATVEFDSSSNAAVRVLGSSSTWQPLQVTSPIVTSGGGVTRVDISADEDTLYFAYLQEGQVFARRHRNGSWENLPTGTTGRVGNMQLAEEVKISALRSKVYIAVRYGSSNNIRVLKLHE